MINEEKNRKCGNEDQQIVKAELLDLHDQMPKVDQTTHSFEGAHKLFPANKMFSYLIEVLK